MSLTFVFDSEFNHLSVPPGSCDVTVTTTSKTSTNPRDLCTTLQFCPIIATFLRNLAVSCKFLWSNPCNKKGHACSKPNSHPCVVRMQKRATHPTFNEQSLQLEDFARQVKIFCTKTGIKHKKSRCIQNFYRCWKNKGGVEKSVSKWWSDDAHVTKCVCDFFKEELPWNRAFHNKSPEVEIFCFEGFLFGIELLQLKRTR